MAIAIARSTSRLDRIAHTIFHANGQFPAREPRELGIVRRLLEVPLGDLAAPLDLVVQTGAVLTEFCRVKFLAAHLEIVVPEIVGDIAAIGRLGRRRWRCGRRGLGGGGPVDMIPIVGDGPHKEVFVVTVGRPLGVKAAEQIEGCAINGDVTIV